MHVDLAVDMVVGSRSIKLEANQQLSFLCIITYGGIWWCED